MSLVIVWMDGDEPVDVTVDGVSVPFEIDDAPLPEEAPVPRVHDSLSGWYR